MYEAKKRGRPSEKLTIVSSRPLTEQDHFSRASQAEVNQIKKVTERHHALARLIARGATNEQAAVQQGFHIGRVRMLQADPTFVELVAFYREQVDEEFTEVVQHLAGLTKDVILTVRDRLEESPEDFTNNELTSLLTATLDRTGHGPSSTSRVDLNVNLGQRIDEARRRALEARRSQIIDITPEEIPRAG